MEKINRRTALKKLTLSVGGLSVLQQLNATATDAPPQYKTQKPIKKVTAITLGAGSRGNTYGKYAINNPDELDIVGVAEPIAIRNERYAQKHNIEAKNRFVTWEDVLKLPKFADAVIISMPDHLHYEPCLEAMAKGYHVLLEKPIAQSESECRDILKAAKKHNRIVAVCHVLRYAPYFQKLKTLIDAGAIGELISIQHFEPIEHIHMSHSFVRGNWHNSKETTPIIIAKSCHDLDILRWLVGKPAKRVTAFGGLKWFKKTNQPKGAAARCLDCAVEKECPYSATKIYYPKGSWNYVFDLPDDPNQHADFITNALKTTNYGRCVYDMDNDQCDHIVANIEFEGGATASFSMEAFTDYHGRRTRIMGAMGNIVGDMKTFTHTDFRTGKTTVWDAEKINEGVYATNGHGGGDMRLASDWVQAVAAENPNLLTSTIDASIESHVIGYRAEKSRLRHSVENIKL